MSLQKTKENSVSCIVSTSKKKVGELPPPLSGQNISIPEHMIQELLVGSLFVSVLVLEVSVSF